MQIAQVSSNGVFNLYGTMRKHVYTQPNMIYNEEVHLQEIMVLNHMVVVVQVL